MRKKKKIQDYEFSYAVMKIHVDSSFRQYFRKIYVEGLENIPQDKRVIIAPNHQNALMDALAVLMTQKGQPVFLARSDVFKNKKVARILHWLNILPVYRMRDGRDELGKNSEIFDLSIDVLRDKVTLCLMPEGQQSFKRTLLPLVKGMFRIAFSAQEEVEPDEVVIVPLGIEYDEYVHPGGDLSMRFGKPIPVMDYMPLYRENQAVALNRIKQDVSDGLDVLIQNIRSQTHYDEFYSLSLMAQDTVCTKKEGQKRAFARLDARQKISMALDAEEQTHPVAIQQLCSKHADYQKKLSSFRLKDFVFGHPQRAAWTLTKGLLLLLTLPFFVAGWAANFIPSFFSNLMAKRFKNDFYKSTVNIVMRIALYPIYYLLIIIALSFIFKSVLIVVIACVASLLLSRFVFFYRLWVKDAWGRIRFLWRRMRNGKEMARLAQLRKGIVTEVVGMVK
ncbi:MAG: 1-acyl-sn-glycerol-3-phosphate acyltransferase [Bacteroidales bacterium]|nr:1-acyl-sn-glycerol-3-phosphate acyltransferase [Bacteroidales bacterium]